MKLDRRAGRYVPGFLLISLIFVCLFSCNWFSDLEFVTVEVTNETEEDISVDTGRTFISIDVLTGQTVTMSVVKDVRVSARGKTSDRVYSSRTFTWDMNYWVVR